MDLGQWGNDKWQVVGIYQAAYDIRILPESAFAPLSAVNRATKQYYRGNRFYVQTHSLDDAGKRKFARQLQTLYEERGFDLNPVLTATTVQNKVNAIRQFNITVAYLSMLAVIVAAVGGIGLMGALSISVVERTREIGVMRSIGASSADIMGMFMLEGVLQGLLSWVVAVPISYIVARPVANQLGQIMLSMDLEYFWL